MFWLLGLIVGVFVAQAIGGMLLGADYIGYSLTLWSPTLEKGFVWTLLTYALVHGGVMHLLGNGLGILFIGLPVQQMVGSRHFVWLSGGAALAGSLLYLTFHLGSGGFALVGASAIVLALLTVFCLSRMDEMMTLLLFFVFPVTLKPRWVLYGSVAVEVIVLVAEVQGTAPWAASAHLGGIAAGYIYFTKWVQGRSLFSRKLLHFPRQRSQVARPRGTGRSGAKPRYRVNIGNRTDLRSEVDRILDKINSQGFGSLSPEEKQLLDRARDILSK